MLLWEGEWGGGMERLPAISALTGKSFRIQLQNQNEKKKKVFNEEFIRVQIYSFCIHVPLRGRFICS